MQENVQCPLFLGHDLLQMRLLAGVPGRVAARVGTGHRGVAATSSTAVLIGRIAALYTVAIKVTGDAVFP